jgi:hypothetical protein
MLFLPVLLCTIFYAANGFNSLSNVNTCSRQCLQMSDNDDPMPLIPEIVDNDDPMPLIPEIVDYIPPRYNKKLPRKAQWFPLINLKAPEMLDGSLAGDVGFDPLGFSKSKKTLYWMREAEIKHARLAMLAAVGWPLSELWHKSLASVFDLDSILASGDRAPSILNGGLSNVYATSILVGSAVVAGILENKAMSSGVIFWNSEKPEGYVPGDYGFDPLGFYTKKGGDKLLMETAEIKNGRLAMIAITAYVAQESFTGLPVVEQTPYLF